MISNVEYHITLVLLSVSAFNTLVVLVMLFFNRTGNSPANKFLVFYLFCMATVMFMMFVIRSHLILDFAWLYRIPSPLYYLMFPAAYLYVRMVLFDENKLRKSDFLHALPALLHLIEYIPYYLLPLEAKQQIVAAQLNDPLGGWTHQEGWFPPYTHNIIRGVLGTAYSIAMVRLLMVSHKYRPESEAVFPLMKRWLLVFSLMLLVFSLSLIILLLLPHFFPKNMLAFNMYFWLSATQIVTSLTLLSNHSLLYGMPRLRKGNPQLHIGKQTRTQPTESVLEIHKVYIDAMNRFMLDHKPFLKQGYSLDDLSKDLEIPDHHLSFILNHLLNTRFNDYMNLSRIRFLDEKVKTEDVAHLSLEGLAREAGFGSRITFIRAVQKHTGKNPSDYFNTKD